MDKFLYIFAADLAKRLQQEGFNLHSSKEGERPYWLFTINDTKTPTFLFTFTAGKDYVFSNKLFF